MTMISYIAMHDFIVIKSYDYEFDALQLQYHDCSKVVTIFNNMLGSSDSNDNTTMLHWQYLDNTQASITSNIPTQAGTGKL